MWTSKLTLFSIFINIAYKNRILIKSISYILRKRLSWHVRVSVKRYRYKYNVLNSVTCSEHWCERDHQNWFSCSSFLRIYSSFNINIIHQQQNVILFSYVLCHMYCMYTMMMIRRKFFNCSRFIIFLLLIIMIIKKN